MLRIMIIMNKMKKMDADLFHLERILRMIITVMTMVLGG